MIEEPYIGDMLMMARADPPRAKALAVVALYLHQAVERLGLYKPDISQQSCVLCSLAVRDFLHRVGFPQARVAPVVAVMRASGDGKELHSCGIGVPNAYQHTRTRWNGHMCVLVDNVLVDTTLYQAKRPQWPGLPGMMAVPLGVEDGSAKIDITDARPGVPGGRVYGLDLLAAAITDGDESDAGYKFTIMWLDNPTNRWWRNGPDGRRDVRRPIVAALTAIHNKWP